MKFGAALLAVGICIAATELRAQTTTTSVTTTKGAFTEFVPGSRTVVVRTEATRLRCAMSLPNKRRSSTNPARRLRSNAFRRQSAGDRLHRNGRPARGLTHRCAKTGGSCRSGHDRRRRYRTYDHDNDHNAPSDARRERSAEEAKRRAQGALKEEIEKRKEALEKAKDKLDDDD